MYTSGLRFFFFVRVTYTSGLQPWTEKIKYGEKDIMGSFLVIL